MLAQSFKSSDDLGITEPQKAELIKTLALLETEKLEHVSLDPNTHLRPAKRTGKFTGHFNMNYWCNKHKCGTIACIGGTAQMIGGVEFGQLTLGLDDLFYPKLPSERYTDITPAQAATALRSYLTTGDSKWSEAVAP